MVGQDIELDVSNIAHGGVSVARLEGRVVFVADAIPGERVVARVTDDSKRGFWRADTVRVLDASPHRQPHIWAEAALERDPEDRAGGAEFGHIVLSHQRALKAQVLQDALHRMAKVDHDVVVEALPGEPDGTGWRTRVRLHVADDGTVGPYAARSHRVIRVASLPLATAEVRSIAPIGDSYSGTETVDVVAPSAGEPRLIVGRQAPSVIRERVGSREFRLDDGGFWQVHRAAPETLTNAVRDAVIPELLDPSASNLDLYGGVGLLAAALGDLAGPGLRVTSVESDARATAHAAENLAEWGNAEAETGRVEHWVRRLADRIPAATVILDPPRSGAGREVVDALAAVTPAQIVYVACDPVAFARDVAIFAEHGYQLQKLRAFDLFPNTHHVESVGTLVRG